MFHLSKQKGNEERKRARCMLEFLILQLFEQLLPKSHLVDSMNTIKDPDNTESGVSDISDCEMCILNLEQAGR